MEDSRNQKLVGLLLKVCCDHTHFIYNIHLNTEWLVYDIAALDFRAYFHYTQLHTDLEESEAPYFVQRQRLDGRSYR